MAIMREKNWLLRYLHQLLIWSFTRFRIHQAIVALVVGVLFIAGNFVGISWLNTLPQAVPTCFVIWFVILTFLVAPACLWHQQDLKLLLSAHPQPPRPQVIIDGYKVTYAEDSETGEIHDIEWLHIVNRGNAPAVNIEIPPIMCHKRAARLLSPLPTSLGQDQSTDARILSLKRGLEEVNKNIPKVRGEPWSVRLPLTVKYSDPNHCQWRTDHFIIFDVRGISFEFVQPDEPPE
jgi:hypothetical protein